MGMETSRFASGFLIPDFLILIMETHIWTATNFAKNAKTILKLLGPINLIVSFLPPYFSVKQLFSNDINIKDALY